MITLRLNKNGGINKGDVVFYESDNISEKYVIQLYKNNAIYDLTGKTIELTIVEKKRKYGNIFNLPIENATEGKFRLLVTSDISKECGLYDFKVTVKDDTGLVETFPSFQVEVLHNLTRSIASEIVNSDDFEILTEGLKALSDYNIYKENAMKVPRIEEDITEINSQLDTIVQSPNLVDKLEKLIQVRGMYARVASDNSIRVGVGMNNSLKSIIEYRFVYNADGLLLLRGVLSGVENPNANKVNITLNGTFNTNTSGQAYTTTVGDKFTFEFTGQSLFFKRYCEARGGVWKITLNNGMERKVTCYSETGGYKEELIFDNLEYATYKGVAEFLGADSFDSDTSIVRGYLFYGVDSSTVLPLRVGKVLPINESTAKYIVSENSVPDYAIQGRKSGTTTSFAWSPVHGATTGVSNSISTKVYFNGVSEITSPNGVPGFSYKEIDSFSISQKFDVYNPNAVSDGVLWKHNINHIIDIRNPYLTIQNAMNLMQDVNFGLGYFGMLPSKQSTMNKLMLNNGVEYSTLPTVAQEDYYDCKVTSGVFIGELISGNYHACAIDMSSVIDNYNIGKDFEPTQKARISFRTDDIAKIYFTALRGVDIPNATKLSCQNRICCVSGIQYPNDSLGI